LSPGIIRGRSCASVLIVPRRKMTLVGDLHRRAAMAGLRALWPAMESSPGREEMRREKSRGVGRLLAVGGGGTPCGELHGDGALGPTRVGASLLPSWGRRGRRRERKGKKKGKEKIKEEKMGKFSKVCLQISFIKEQNMHN
jgi:hypothetical protein